MTSIWFPNNKYPPNTKNYLPCFVLGGGGLVLGGRDYWGTTVYGNAHSKHDDMSGGFKDFFLHIQL